MIGAALGAVLCLLIALCAGAAAQTDSALDGASPANDLDAVMAAALQPMTGDLDAMLERRMLRMAIPPNPIYFSYDGEKIIGLAVEMAREFESHLRKAYGVKIGVVPMPFARDEILAAVVEGRADIAVANLTITPERQEIVAFSRPVVDKVAELVVTGPAAGAVSSFEDLVEIGLYLRASSSYYAHLERFNREREAAGKPPIPVFEVDERLEDYDLLELLHAGTIPAIVVDHHKLELWTQVFDDIVVHDDLVLNEGGQIAWALRKDAPQLLDAVNAFIPGVKQGSLIGNVLLQRYLGDARWIEDIRAGGATVDYENAVAVIKNYAAEYGFDWEMVVAQAYQESKLDQTKTSHAGAVGVMQVLPRTATDPNVAIPDIHELENNVHAGVKYLRFLRDRYFEEPEIAPFDRVLLSLAAYNAGPAAITRARKKTERMGLDPNAWLGNVEIGAARAIGQEPVTYVRNIYKYSVSLRLTGGFETVAQAVEVADAAEVVQPASAAADATPTPVVGERPAWQLWAIGILLAIAALALAVYVVQGRRSREGGEA